MDKFSLARLVRRVLAGAAALALVNLGLSGWSADIATGQWILVTPPGCEAILAPLVEQRRAEGFKVVVLQTTNVLSPEQVLRGDGSPLRARLQDLTDKYAGPNYLLLAGNISAATETNADVPRVPSLRGAVGRMAGQPSDLGYALPSADGLPRLRVGRLPARNLEDLRDMVRKTLSFEQETPPAAWQNRLLLLVGNPGGGLLGEMFMQQNLKAHLATLHPAWQMRTIINIESSPYYLPRPQDRQSALEYLRQGNLFSVYLGHSDAGGMGLDGRFMLRKNWSELDIPRGAGPFISVGCWACQSGSKGDGYGFAAMRNPAGPVAVIGASGESYSAGGELVVEGLLGVLARPPFPTRLGDYWLAAQEGLARGKMDPATFAVLDAADGSGGKVPLGTQRLEHLEIWMLLGDPALRLPLEPVDISLAATAPAVPGKTITVNGKLPLRLRGASVRVTLERPLNSSPLELEKVPTNSPENSAARERIFASNHRLANTFDLATVEAKASGNEFIASLPVPIAVPWTNLILRAWATIGNESGVGVFTLPVKAEGPAAQTAPGGS